jgi:polyphosphate kinase
VLAMTCVATKLGDEGDGDSDGTKPDGTMASAGAATARPARYFIGSADLMERNLDRRIEAIVPVRDPELCGRLEDTIALDLADDTHTWALGGDGAWRRLPPQNGVNAQAELQRLALERAKRRHPAELTH